MIIKLISREPSNSENIIPGVSPTSFGLPLNRKHSALKRDSFDSGSLRQSDASHSLSTSVWSAVRQPPTTSNSGLVVSQKPLIFSCPRSVIYVKQEELIYSLEVQELFTSTKYVQRTRCIAK